MVYFCQGCGSQVAEDASGVQKAVYQLKVDGQDTEKVRKKIKEMSDKYAPFVDVLFYQCFSCGMISHIIFVVQHQEVLNDCIEEMMTL